MLLHIRYEQPTVFLNDGFSAIITQLQIVVDVIW